MGSTGRKRLNSGSVKGADGIDTSRTGGNQRGWAVLRPFETRAHNRSQLPRALPVGIP